MGQEWIKGKMETMLWKHLTEFQSTTFLVGGDNGCGKTRSMELLSEVLTQPCFPEAVKIINCAPFRAEPSHSVSQQIRDIIVKQLQICPDSLIILDDAQLITSKTWQLLRDVLKPSIKHIYINENDRLKTIPKNRMILGLVTDFGQSIATTREITTPQALDDLFRQEVRRLWGEDPDLLEFFKYELPFQYLSHTEMKQLVQQYVSEEVAKIPSKWFRVKIEDSVLDEIVKDVEYAFPDQCGRGVTKWLDQYLKPPLLTFVKKASRSFATIEIHEYSNGLFKFRFAK